MSSSGKNCIQDTLSSCAALGLPAACSALLGRVRRASKGILPTMERTSRAGWWTERRVSSWVISLLTKLRIRAYKYMGATMDIMFSI